MYEDWYDDDEFDSFEKIRPKSKPRSGKEKMTAAARSYGKKADFYQRAEVAVNVIEGVGHAVKRGA